MTQSEAVVPEGQVRGKEWVRSFLFSVKIDSPLAQLHVLSKLYAVFLLSLVVLLEGVVLVPRLVEGVPTVDLLVSLVPAVRDVLVPFVSVVRLVPTTCLRPEVPVVVLSEAEDETVLLPPSVATFEVFFTFPALTECLEAAPLPVEIFLRWP